MHLPRPTFLPVFFTCLIVAFAIAVTLRIQSYSSRTTEVVPPSAPEASPAGGSRAIRQAGGPPAGKTGVATTSTVAAASPAKAHSAARELRERRFEELLSQGRTATAGTPTTAAAPVPPPVVAPPVKPAPKPSLLPRMANATTGNSAAPVPPPPRPPAPTPPRSADRKADDRDPSSDTTPPQLLGIEFAPPVVKDGDTIGLTVFAQDDSSGIRSIVGNIVGPSGAILGFVQSREADTLRYVGRVTIPKNAAEGSWHINYLNLTDNAGNSKALLWTQGALPDTAAFKVTSSTSDSTPPVLRRVWLDRPSMKLGEKNTLFVQADDDKSGVALVTGVFVSPQKFARFGFGCKQADPAWQCELVPPAAAECGDWPLEQISLQDGAGNPITVRGDNPMISGLRLNILTDQCDSRPPVIQSISIDPTRPSRPGTVTVTVIASDDMSGVASISGYFGYAGAVGPGGRPPQLPFFCRLAEGQVWTGTITITNDTPRGIWRLSSIQALDKANNLKVYSQADPIVSSVAMRIQ